MPDTDDFKRLEDKVDKLGEAVAKLVIFEERQTTQGERLGSAEQRLAALEKATSLIDNKVERWLNRAWGAYFVAAAAGAAGMKLLGH